MSDELTLDQMLSDEEVEATEAETESEEVEQNESSEQEPTEEAGEETEAAEADEPTGEKTDDAPPASETDGLTEKERAYYAKARDEARKRQELEAELKQYRDNQAQQEPAKAPDIFEDQDGFIKHYEDRLAQAELNTKVSMSQAFMRKQHEDYDEKEVAFMDLAKSDPSLLAQAKSHPFPAEFVYSTVQKHERFSKFDNFDDAVKSELEKSRAAMEKELREKIEKEYQAKLNKAQSIPPSGAGGSLGTDNTAVPDDSLEDILGN